MVSLLRDPKICNGLTLTVRLFLDQHLHYVLSHHCWGQECVPIFYSNNLHGPSWRPMQHLLRAVH